MATASGHNFRFGLKSLAGLVFLVAAVFTLLPSHVAIFVVGTVPLALFLTYLLWQWLRYGQRVGALTVGWGVILLLLCYIVSSGPAMSLTVKSNAGLDGELVRVLGKIYYPVFQVARTNDAGRRLYSSYLSNWMFGAGNRLYIEPYAGASQLHDHDTEELTCDVREEALR